MKAGNPVERETLMSPIKKKSMVDAIINKITDAVISGELKPGDKLPTEAKLAETMSASKNTIREAIKILVAYGVVEIRRPEGTFITNGFSKKMLDPMLYSIIYSKTSSAEDLLGLRQMIDYGISHLVMQQGLSVQARDRLERIYDSLCEKILKEDYDVREIAEEDIALHHAMASATNNDLVKMMHDVLADLTYESRVRSVENIYADNNRQYLVDTHRRVLDILEGKSKEPLGGALEYSYIYWKHSIK